MVNQRKPPIQDEYIEKYLIEKDLDLYDISLFLFVLYMFRQSLWNADPLLRLIVPFFLAVSIYRTATKKIILKKELKYTLWIGAICGITWLGPNTCIYDHDHVFSASTSIHENIYSCENVTIGENVWIGANCIILKGTSIGSDSVIAAGSIVKGDVPCKTLLLQKRNTELRKI